MAEQTTAPTTTPTAPVAAPAAAPAAPTQGGESAPMNNAQMAAKVVEIMQAKKGTISAAPATPAATEAQPAQAEGAPLTPEQQEAKAANEELRTIARAKAAARQAREQARQASARAQALETQRQADLARVRELAELEAGIKDPAKLLELANKAGVTAKQLHDAVLREDTPEAIFARAREEAEKAAAAKIAEWQKEQQEGAQRAQAAAAERAFVTLVTGETSKYEALNALYTPQQLVMEAWNVIRQANERGIRVRNDGEIADYLEAREKGRYDKLRQKLSNASGMTTSNGTSQKTAATGTAAKAPALGNNVAGSAATPPPDPDKMSRSERLAYLLDQYKAATAGR